ncbi:RidA family protein [Fibrisoma montanum]|uniref:RidA family protein n=1 Tax=Fibrisoma montanum TaxID=2305895 RepID=A0A418MBC7_9BACT|nr:Rid family hydrolase [Fibrisoma montanum]RIV23683.1 RidA family protein [Fibrisoma montanum]
MKRLFLGLICALLTTLASAQSNPVQFGYTYKVDTGIQGKQVYITGQRPFNEKGELVGAGDLSAQIRQVYENVKTALGKVGLTLRDVKQVTYHLKGEPGQVSALANQQILQSNTIYFPDGAPKLSELKNIPKIIRDDVLIEVEVIASK